MYVVHNVTNRTIVLADLRAEIKPRGVLDLERVTSRANIDSSNDLKSALRSKILQLGRHSVIRTKEVAQPQSSTTIIEKEASLDETKIAEMVREAVRAEMQVPQIGDVNEVVRTAVSKGIDTLMGSLRDKINSVQPSTQQPQNEPVVDPEKIAAISQAAIDKISNEIEGGQPSLGKKYKTSKSVRDLANDL